MNSEFSHWAATHTNEELRESIEQRGNLLPETVEAAIAELQHRGDVFSAEELKIIKKDLQERCDNAARFNAALNNQYKYSVVDDPLALSFYSRRVVYVLSIIFGTFVGSILLAINISKTKNTLGVILALLFGIAFTALRVFVSFKVSSSISIIVAFIGAACLDHFYWNRFLGATFYRARSFWPPVIIAMLFLLILILYPLKKILHY